MPGSPYLDEEPPGLMTWPQLMRILLFIFIFEVFVGTWVWTQFPDWRWLVYLILGIDLVALIGFYVWTTRVAEGEGDVE